MGSETVISWSDLPDELVGRIGKCLVDNPFDVLHFRAVCKTWRSSIPPFKSNSPDLSLQLPFPLNFHHPNTFPGFYLIENTVYLFQLLPPDRDTSPDYRGCWLVKVSKTADGKLRVFNPVTHRRINISPDNNNMPKVMNLLDFRVSQVCKSYRVQHEKLDFVRKVLLCTHETSNISLLAFGEAYKYNHTELFYSKSLDENWNILKDGSFNIVDIIVYKGNFVAVDRCGKTVEFDSSSFNETVVSSILHDRETARCRKKRLVESNGQLFLVDMVLDYGKAENVEFRVYRVDEELHEWIAVHTLGDRIFFISYDCCFSVSSQDLGYRYAGNCIYYAERGIYIDDGREKLIHRYNNKGLDGLNMSVYTIEEGEIGPGLSFFEYEDLFWPPASRPNSKDQATPSDKKLLNRDNL